MDLDDIVRRIDSILAAPSAEVQLASPAASATPGTRVGEYSGPIIPPTVPPADLEGVSSDPAFRRPVRE